MVEIDTGSGKKELPESKQIIQSQGLASIESPELIKWQLESESLLDDIRNQLLGLVYVQQEQNKELVWIMEEKGKQWCNEKGAIAITSILRPYLYKAFTLSNYDTERINKTMLRISVNITQHLAAFCITYQIIEEDLPMLKGLICDLIESNLWRAYQMKTFEGQQATVKSEEVYRREAPIKKNPFPFSATSIGRRIARGK